MYCHFQASQLLQGAGALFVFGLVGSIHCLGMCGPLSALLDDGKDSGRTFLSYHAGRLVAYGTLGGLLFLLGFPLQWAIPWPWLPLLWAGPLLLFAFRPPRLPAWMSTWHLRLSSKTLAWRPVRRGLALGLLTPLLPCGLLYAAGIAALAAPHPWTAVGWMLAFGLGTAPALWAGQAGLQRLKHLQQGLWNAHIRRFSAFLTALTLLLMTKP